uniref:Uncharacterized protein n=1 Tax=Arundo donax TaxID=35708 RepID=A0A0A9EU69_ARUDO
MYQYLLLRIAARNC